MLTIVNCHFEACDFYCGRAWKGYAASVLGNPFKGPDAIEQFGDWLWERIQARNEGICIALQNIRFNDYKLQDEACIAGYEEPVPYRLGCWCSSEAKPKPCHVQEIILALQCPEVIEILNSLPEW